MLCAVILILDPNTVPMNRHVFVVGKFHDRKGCARGIGITQKRPGNFWRTRAVPDIEGK